LTRLLFVNASVYIIITIYLLIFHLIDERLPSMLGEDLALSASSSFTKMLTRPWSIITHMFAHVQFGHFLFNMIALYSMGQMFVSIQGSRKLLTLYILGGLSGFIAFALAYNSSNVLNGGGTHYVLGASAAVMAIVVTTATLQPKRVILLFGVFKIELMWLAGILVLLDLASIRDGVNSGGHIGHIGGAIFGYFYGTQLKKGKDMGAWFQKIIDTLKGIFSRSKMSVASNNGRPKTDEQFNIEKKERQKRIDIILDKISRSGYESLSKDEKDFLFKHSQK
jgi:membrane associated rhomboid family serine protease